METTVWIALILIALIAFALLSLALSRDPDACGASVLGSVLLMICSLALMKVKESPKPKAIDVYRDKTTLQITYQDSIAKDTTVVWKEEFKPK